MKPFFAAVVISIILAGILIIGCNRQNTSPLKDDWHQDFTTFAKYDDAYWVLSRCAWQEIDYAIEESEFCAIAEVTITKDTHDDMKPYYKKKPIWQREGKLKIKSLIYGNPETGEIPFSYKYGRRTPKTPWSFLRSPDDPAGCGLTLYAGGPTSIILGKGKGEKVTLLRAVDESAGLISSQAIKAMKELMNLDPREFQDQRQNLLLHSGNRELLLHLFIRTMRKGNMGDTVEFIKTLASQGLDTPERRFLADGMALFVLCEFNNTPSNLYTLQEKTNDAQQEILIDIVSQDLSRVTNLPEGIRHLKLMGWFFYVLLSMPEPYDLHKQVESASFIPSKGIMDKDVTKLKERLRPIILSLSEKFKNNKDSPEWRKWVNKIFSVEILVSV
ncbi:MAG: hypothetical protein HY762_03110 [Planctomycetes bacterium]|nr:hypothetical protein [Planctomycetota bacterium]